MKGGGIESLPEGAVVVPVGADGFVMPWPYFRATSSQVARIEVAAMLGLAGMVLEDGALTAERRRLLGEVAGEMATEARRRAKIPEGRSVRAPANLYIEDGPLALVPARALGLPLIRTDEGPKYAPAGYRSPDRTWSDPEPELPAEMADLPALLAPGSMSQNQAYRVALAEFYQDRATALRLQRAKDKGRKTDEERNAELLARRILLRLHHDTVQDTEAEAVGEAVRAQSEAAALRKARREAISARRRVLELKADDKPGDARAFVLEALWRFRSALRRDDVRPWLWVASRGKDDGLANLLNSGTLTKGQFNDGVRFRGLYLLTERSLGSSMGDHSGSGDDGSYLERCAAALVTRKRIEARIMTTRNQRALTALRLVAGEGRTINAISAAGRSSDRLLNTKALVLALGHVRAELERAP